MSAGIFTRLADESYIVLKRKSERERIRQKKLTARKRVERFAALLPDICVEGDDGEECIATFFWSKFNRAPKSKVCCCCATYKNKFHQTKFVELLFEPSTGAFYARGIGRRRRR